MVWDSLSVSILIVCLVALVGIIGNAALRSRTWAGYESALRWIALLPRQLRQSVTREDGDVVLRGNHRGWPAVIRISDSDFKPALHMTLGVPLNYALEVVPRNATSGEHVGVAFLSGDARFDQTFALFSNNPEDARVLLFNDTSLAALQKLCVSSRNAARIEKRQIEVHYSTTPKDLAGEVLVSLEAMASLARHCSELPDGPRIRIAPFRPEGTSLVAKAAIVIGAVVAIATVLAFRSPDREGTVARSFALSDGSVIDARDARVIPYLDRWQLATEADFNPDFVARLHYGGAGFRLPFRLRPMDSDAETETAYVLKAMDGSKRVVILVNGRLIYDSRYQKLEGVARVSKPNLGSIKWADDPNNAEGFNGDGLLLVLDSRDPQGARLLLAGPGDDAEGIDAGELDYYRNEAVGVAAADPVAADRRRPRVTPSLWPDTDPLSAPGTAGRDQLAPTAAAGIGRGLISGGSAAARGGGAAQRGASLSGPATGGGWLAGVPASPELLAKVAALPPADESPGVDQSFARAQDRSFTLRRLLRPFAIALAIGLVLDALDALASTVMPLLVRGGVDNGVERTALSAAARFDIIALVSVIGLGIVLADWVINWLQTNVVGRNGERLLYTLRVKIFAHLQRLGLDFYEHELTGRIMTRMTTDVDALSSFFQTGLITMVNSVLTFFVVLALMLIINVRLGLILCTVLPVLIVATVVFRRLSSRAYSEARERVSVVNADLQENVAGLRVAQAYRREQVNSERFAGLSGAYRVSRLRAQRMIALYFPFVQALSTIGGAVVLFAAAGEIRSGAITIGSLIAYLLWVDSLFAPVQQMSQVFDGYQQANVGLQRIRALLQTPTSTPPAEHPIVPGSGGGAGRLRGAIELRDVHFGYAGQRKEAIAGVSLSIAPGDTVALVGQTGAGKSTLVKLVARFYDVTSGSVTVDGIDVRDYDLPGYRQQLGVVPQEPHLFAGTVRDAIAYGRPDATDAEVEAAARGVGAIEMISRLPGGFRHEVAERGRNLAAGQRQLIALARAYLVDPAILLLDEATAALDLAAEAAVNRATEQLAARRTTLVVAHRLTTAAKADRIVVLADGRIAESGTHDELLALGGSYAGMWAAFTGAAELAAEVPAR